MHSGLLGVCSFCTAVLLYVTTLLDFYHGCTGIHFDLVTNEIKKKTSQRMLQNILNRKEETKDISS